MAIRYLRRPPKPVERVVTRKIKREFHKPALQPAALAAGDTAPEVLPQERSAMAQALAYFCVACGREHVTGGVREDDICSAESQIDAAMRRSRP